MREDYMLREEVALLVETLFESRLGAERAERLEDLVTYNPLACRYYLEIVGLYEGLYRWSRESGDSLGGSEKQTEAGTFCDLSDLDIETLWGIVPADQQEGDDDPPANPILGFLGDCFKDGISFLGRNITLLIIFLPLLAIGTVAWMSPTLWGPKPSWTLAARVVKTVNCQWKSGSCAPGDGSFLIPGQELNLEVGLAEIEFSSGAKVILQGPAQFITTDSNVSRLVHGRLAAKIPKNATGFTVLTPQHEVVDLGTEFGVFVGKSIDESTEVHVFKGLVEVDDSDSRSSKTAMKLIANEAIVCDTKNHRITHIPASPQTFARDLDSLTGVTIHLGVSNPSFEYPDIRGVPGFQVKHGDTGIEGIEGWKYSAIRPDGSSISREEMSEAAPYAGYQISPYRSPNGERWNVDPGATDGRQVAVLRLNDDMDDMQPACQIWLYQSLGTVGAIDVGRRLLLEVDAGPRSKFFCRGTGTLVASFAMHVTGERAGVCVGAQGTLNVTDSKQGLQTIQAILPVTSNLVGQELFVVLMATDKEYAQYHFDNVRLSIASDKPKKKKKNSR